MEITFTRTGEREYATTARREDGVLVQIPSHDRPATLPHDLAHLLVEQELGITQGFWGSVAAGALFGGMRVLSGRRPPRAEDRSRAVIRQAGQRLTEAEVLVGILLELACRGQEPEGAEVEAALRDAWAPTKGERVRVRREQAAQLCQALRTAQRQWLALAPGESVTLRWQERRRRG